MLRLLIRRFPRLSQLAVPQAIPLSILRSLRAYAQLANNVSESTSNAAAFVRNTVKPLDSRKTFLIDRYAYIIRNRPLMVFVQHNNLLKSDSLQIRNQFKKIGVTFTVLRVNLFNVALRNSSHPDPASWEAQQMYRGVRHPLKDLLAGPTAVVSFDDVDPQKLKSVVDVVEKSGGRLLLLGAWLDERLLDREEVGVVKNFGTLDQLRSGLLGVLEVLRGAGLANTLSSTSTSLYLTLEGRKKQLSGDDDAESA
ncbi:hypothetical protein V1508DRAFT_435513 [Lipomyces doorenjongii]|uniref:mitochondrial 54S ribosomal protein uL10m n=1 Tax=Lipomyces doorenjongii TaxID=383834 RepID=UPI0034CD3597